MNAIIKILVFLTIFTGVFAQDDVQRIPASMESVDTLIQERGTDYSQLFGNDFNVEYETELFIEKSFYGMSLIQYEHYSGKSYTAKISYRNQTARRFMYGYNGGFYYVPNKESNTISYAIPYTTCVATWMPVVTDNIDIAIDFEGGIGYSMNYFMGTNQIAPFISVGAGADIKLSDNSIVAVRTSINIVPADNTEFIIYDRTNFLTNNSGASLFSISIGLHLSEIKYKQEQD